MSSYDAVRRRLLSNDTKGGGSFSVPRSFARAIPRPKTRPGPDHLTKAPGYRSATRPPDHLVGPQPQKVTPTPPLRDWQPGGGPRYRPNYEGRRATPAPNNVELGQLVTEMPVGNSRLSEMALQEVLQRLERQNLEPPARGPAPPYSAFKQPDPYQAIYQWYVGQGGMA